MKSKLFITLLAAVSLGLCAWQGLQLRDQDTRDSRDSAAVRVASEQVLDLTTMDSTSVGEQLTALRGRSTGDFQKQLSEITDVFERAIRQSKVDASGTVDRAGLSSRNGDRAVVLVASTAKVTNTEQAKPVDRTYRIRVSLQWSDGKWLVDGMEFVS